MKTFLAGNSKETWSNSRGLAARLTALDACLVRLVSFLLASTPSGKAATLDYPPKNPLDWQRLCLSFAFRM